MKIKIALIFSSFILLQACGSKNMMYSEVSVDNADVTLVSLRS